MPTGYIRVKKDLVTYCRRYSFDLLLKSWPRMEDIIRFFIVDCLTLLLMLGCSGSEAPTLCPPGITEKCACLDGNNGMRTCNKDGSGFGECVCSCTPNCEGKQCGPDGCNGECGDCQSDQICNAAGRCQSQELITPDLVVSVSQGPDLDYGATALVRPADGAWVIVFERFESSRFAGKLMAAVSTNHKEFASPEALSFGSDPLQVGPTSVTINQQPYLFFMSGDAQQNQSKLVRSPLLTDGAFGPPEEIKLADAFTGMLAWPAPIAAPSGPIVLGYDHYQADTRIASSTDGVQFGADITLGSGVMGRPASFGNGSLCFTYQSGFGGSMTAYVRLSADFQNWSQPVRVSNLSGNVHDAWPFTRIDGGVDLYYLSPGANGFKIFRRAITSDGRLGSEQPLTNDAVGPVTQPHPHRLGDGSILLTFTREIRSQSDYDVACSQLTQDAPAAL